MFNKNLLNNVTIFKLNNFGNFFIFTTRSKHNSSCHEWHYFNIVLYLVFSYKIKLLDSSMCTMYHVENNKYVCPKSIFDSFCEISQVASGDTMYDVTGANISDWILKSQNRYGRSR